jgi:GNAT superfamily N-acetyltransferase
MTKISYAWNEDYDAFRIEGKALIERHWNEVGSHRDILRLDVDHTRYVALQKAGVFHLLTARADGKLIGYFGVLITPHTRDRNALIGMDEFIYAAPDYRRDLVGWRMLKEGMKYLGEAGCHLIAFREKTRRRNGGYLKRLGFQPAELVSTLVIRPPHEDLSNA